MSIKPILSLAIAFALLTVLIDAHSWADCVDWRFNNPNKPGWRESDGKCFGWARQYPVNSGVPFGHLDSASPNRHYQQDPKDFTSCSDKTHGAEPGSDERRQNPISRAYGGRWGTMASAKAGDKMCVRWPAQTHAVEDEQDRGVFINMPPTPTTRDPSQSQLMKMTIGKLPYKNCNNTGIIKTNPCGGCFTVPADRKTGTYLVQWRWELNDNEWYTSCWDLQITGNDANPDPAQPDTEPPAQPGGPDEPRVERPGQPEIEPPQTEEPLIDPSVLPEEPLIDPSVLPEEPLVDPSVQPDKPSTTPPAQPIHPGTELPLPQPSQPGGPGELGQPSIKTPDL